VPGSATAWSAARAFLSVVRDPQCPTPLRGWNGQVEPPEAHRPGHRLGFLNELKREMKGWRVEHENTEVAMKSERAERWPRLDFVRGLTLAGTAGLVGLRPERALAEPPLGLAIR